MRKIVLLMSLSVALTIVWFLHTMYARALLADASACAVELYNRGEFEEAATAFQRLVVQYEQSQGAEHELTLGSRNNLANCLTALGLPEEAIKEHRLVLSAREKGLGPEHADTVASRNNLAVALGALGSSGEAEEQFRMVLNIRERTCGLEHDDVLKTCYALALNLENQARIAEAVVFVRRSEEGWSKSFGPYHPFTQRARAARERIEAAWGR